MATKKEFSIGCIFESGAVLSREQIEKTNRELREYAANPPEPFIPADTPEKLSSFINVHAFYFDDREKGVNVEHARKALHDAIFYAKQLKKNDPSLPLLPQTGRDDAADLRDLARWAESATADDSKWPNQKLTASLIGVSGGQISKLVSARTLATNGKQGKACRINPDSITAYKREKDLKERAGDGQWANGG